jgi:5'-deoxynucleotidase YfbR-like HD superfamily hydrolase
VNINDALNGTIRRLNHIQRYSSFPVIKPENVAQHSWQVAFYTYIIGCDLNRRTGTAGSRFVNVRLAVVKALVHDVSEALSGDVIRSYKYSSPDMRRATAWADYTNMQDLTAEFGEVGEQLFDEWHDAKNNTMEGKLVAFADLVTVVTYIREERAMGNSALNEVLQRCYEDLLRPMRDDPTFGVYVQQLFPVDEWYSEGRGVSVA